MDPRWAPFANGLPGVKKRSPPTWPGTERAPVARARVIPEEWEQRVIHIALENMHLRTPVPRGGYPEPCCGIAPGSAGHAPEPDDDRYRQGLSALSASGWNETAGSALLQWNLPTACGRLDA